MDYREEITRTRPDYVIYDPFGGREPDWDDPDLFWLNEHVLVQEVSGGELLAMWTSERLRPHRLRVMFAHSSDGGRNWTAAAILDGAGKGDRCDAGWQIPVISESGRVYCFYNYCSGKLDITGAAFSGRLLCRTSDDGGHTWSEPADLPVGRGRIDNPDPTVACNWICCQKPTYDAAGRALLPFTRWASAAAGVAGCDASLKQRHSHCELVRIENLNDDPPPESLRLTWLNIDRPITVPHDAIQGAGFAQEPSMVSLPDGRLFLVVRTNTGRIWHTVSEDGGDHWREAAPLRYADHGEEVLQPVSPCPIFRLERGDYLLLFNNNDGYVFGAKTRWEVENRRPAFFARGEFRPGAVQPITWSRPRLFIDNQGVPLGPEGLGRLEAAAYTSLTERLGTRVFWYPDRKVFLLGKQVTDTWLESFAT